MCKHLNVTHHNTYFEGNNGRKITMVSYCPDCNKFWDELDPTGGIFERDNNGQFMGNAPQCRDTEGRST
jgi:hypothetical protein